MNCLLLLETNKPLLKGSQNWNHGMDKVLYLINREFNVELHSNDVEQDILENRKTHGHFNGELCSIYDIAGVTWSKYEKLSIT